jgi:hypothetical protein
MRMMMRRHYHQNSELNLMVGQNRDFVKDALSFPAVVATKSSNKNNM